MREVSFGQYYPAKSFLHKCDPRVKILLLIVYIAAVFVSKNFYALGACAAGFFLAAAFSGIPLKTLVKSVKGILFLLLFMTVLNLFLYEGETELWKWKFITITDQGLLNAGFIVARITLVVLGASLLTLTTSPVEIADGIESLLTPLKYIKFPVHEFALIMSIALRFIPTLLDETDRIIKAQKARGANFESGSIFKRAKALIPVLIPLLISSFRRADELADAMDARCYAGSTNRTKFKKMKVGWRDLLAVIVITALIVGVVFLNKVVLVAL